MSVGFLGVSGVCFADQTAATGSVAFARLGASGVTQYAAGGPPYPQVISISAGSFVWAATPSTSITVPVLSVECDLSPFELSNSDGAVLAGAVLGVWAAGWGIRMVIRALHTDEVKVNDD